MLAAVLRALPVRDDLTGGNLGGLAAGLLPSFPTREAVLRVTGILGATVMPHMIYLHSAMTASEGISESSYALDDTIKLAHRRRLEILVLHVHSSATVPAFSNHDPHETRAWKEEFLSRYISTPHDGVTLLRRLGVPADDVVAVAREISVDLIVLAPGVMTSAPGAHELCARRSRRPGLPCCSSRAVSNCSCVARATQ